MLSEDAHCQNSQDSRQYLQSFGPKAIRSCVMLRIYVFKARKYLCHPLFKPSLSSPVSCLCQTFISCTSILVSLLFLCYVFFSNGSHSSKQFTGQKPPVHFEYIHTTFSHLESCSFPKIQWRASKLQVQEKRIKRLLFEGQQVQFPLTEINEPACMQWLNET